MSNIDFRFQKSVSFSQYSLFNQCPHQWYLKYVKKLRDDKPSIHLVFGTSMHETLQLFFDTMYRKTLKKAEQLDLIGDFKERFLRVYKETLEKNKGVHFSSSEEMREFFDDGVAIIDWFLKKRAKYFSKKGTELIGIEIPLQTQALKGIENVMMNGFIDFVLYDKVLNRYTIYDIKTSTRGWGDKEKKDQIKIYDKSLTNLLKDKFKYFQLNLNSIFSRLDSLDTKKILKRGFSIIRDINNNIIYKKKHTPKNNDDVIIELSDGKIKAKIS